MVPVRPAPQQIKALDNNLLTDTGLIVNPLQLNLFN